MAAQPDTNDVCVAAIIDTTLERARAELDMTWEDFAKELGVSTTTLWRWRKGRVGNEVQKLIVMIHTQKAPSLAG